MTTRRHILLVIATVLALVLVGVYSLTPDIVTGAIALAASGAKAAWERLLRISLPDHDHLARGIDRGLIAALVGVPFLWLIARRARWRKARKRIENQMAARLARTVRGMD